MCSGGRVVSCRQADGQADAIEKLLPCLQETITGPYPEPNDLSSQRSILSTLKINFKSIHPSVNISSGFGAKCSYQFLVFSKCATCSAKNF
jgi:hypothetical protein